MVFDASAARAARRERDAEPFTFSWDGHEFVLGNPDEWDGQALEDTTQGKVLSGFLTILDQFGDGQADRMRRLTRLSGGDINAIMGACGEHFGQGN